MKVVGFDVSTRAVHAVWLDFDSDEAVRKVYDATDCDGDALVRARTLADLLPRRRSSGWDDVGLVAIERPMGPGTRQVGDMMLVCGIVVACLPPEIPVWLLGPTEWRKACGLTGNATKAAVAFFAHAHLLNPVGWSQDSLDAYCVAYAARELNAKAIAKALEAA